MTYPLRGAILRPDGGDVVWAGDEDPATFHLAARTADGGLVVTAADFTAQWKALNGTNRMKLFVFGNAGRGQARLVALLDNLGKGASGACVQNLNLMLGLEEGTGL